MAMQRRSRLQKRILGWLAADGVRSAPRVRRTGRRQRRVDVASSCAEVSHTRVDP